MKEKEREESTAIEESGSEKLGQLEPETFDLEPVANEGNGEGNGDQDPPTKPHRNW